MSNAVNEIVIPESFKEIPVGVPPMLLPMAGCNSKARFVALNYFGTKATWWDGRSSATFSYRAVYEPYVNHPAILFYVQERHRLGSDDNYPTHTLIFDRVNDKTYLAEYESAKKLLSAQHPPLVPVNLTESEFRELVEKFEARFKTMGEMQSNGMFEFFPSVHSRSRETEALTNWLNRNTPAEAKDFFSRYGINFNS